jgi:hypothetical protein
MKIFMLKPRKGISLGKSVSIEVKVMKSGSDIQLVRVTKEKRHRTLYLTYVPSDHSGAISTSFGLFGDITNVINGSKFHDDR